MSLTKSQHPYSLPSVSSPSGSQFHQRHPPSAHKSASSKPQASQSGDESPASLSVPKASVASPHQQRRNRVHSSPSQLPPPALSASSDSVSKPAASQDASPAKTPRKSKSSSPKGQSFIQASVNPSHVVKHQPLSASADLLQPPAFGRKSNSKHNPSQLASADSPAKPSAKTSAASSAVTNAVNPSPQPKSSKSKPASDSVSSPEKKKSKPRSNPSPQPEEKAYAKKPSSPGHHRNHDSRASHSDSDQQSLSDDSSSSGNGSSGNIKYAGANFQNSPAAHNLPIPKFGSRKSESGSSPTPSDRLTGLAGSPRSFTEGTNTFVASDHAQVYAQSERLHSRSFESMSYYEQHLGTPIPYNKHHHARTEPVDMFNMDDDHDSHRISNEELRQKSINLLALLTQSSAPAHPHSMVDQVPALAPAPAPALLRPGYDAYMGVPTISPSFCGPQYVHASAANEHHLAQISRNLKDMLRISS
ncbi:uncharacterized protein BJ171DRAFT_55315 [Polychytrium aggregatum]|uniref:uncharacterized protein n=1 Tax=Polychytrium aggregatum TaxID=110093 RepID=UPI0022FEF25D|nr:uncharacterized protein BJ171DRAFT_55315 [Polychytrium aggregatum]KAI9205937.1 hypothetical protein BJ171DRAFT_55315 [Polychytrium aggregatum]